MTEVVFEGEVGDEDGMKMVIESLDEDLVLRGVWSLDLRSFVWGICCDCG